RRAHRSSLDLRALDARRLPRSRECDQPLQRGGRALQLRLQQDRAGDGTSHHPLARLEGRVLTRHNAAVGAHSVGKLAALLRGPTSRDEILRALVSHAADVGAGRAGVWLRESARPALTLYGN